MIQLPEAFTEKMKGLLDQEYEAFLESYEMDRAQGLRVNPLKADPESFKRNSPFHLNPIPWAREGFYYEPEDRPGKHPYHEAGVYYIQEPSAMAVAELLDPRPGERILDLCAAPGGKTTHIGGRMMGKGFLLSNEIHPLRAKILSQNVERTGIANAVVSNEDSGTLSRRFPEFFDRIVVDAPCSGEGMFRKDEKARTEWGPDQVALCAVRQKEILSNAGAMLKPGGRLLYSTCTFSPEENEQVIESFLGSCPDFSIEQAEHREGLSFGQPQWSLTGLSKLSGTFRIWPHKSQGEGHFLAVLKKKGGYNLKNKENGPDHSIDKPVRVLLEEALREILKEPEPFLTRKEYLLFGDQLYLIPPEMVDLKGLKILRPGLHIGTLKKKRLEPSHALALSLKKDQVKQWVDFSGDGEEIFKYLRGEALPVCGDFQSCLEKKGWVLVNVDGYSLGFAKLAGGILKNHYPKGLRWA